MSADADPRRRQMGPEDPLLSVAGKISSGEPVDWTKIQDQIATPDQAAVATELKSLERFARANEEVPASWGRFQIIEQIGLGTFGTVYRALDPTLQLEIALKVTRPRIPELTVEQDRALEEVRRLVKVKHPSVVRVFGVERLDNEIGLAMELVKGHTLDEIVKRDAPFSANEATLIGIDVCRALAAVHGAGILHGDIKAHNVMREEGGRTVLMDFGTGRHLKNEPSGGSDFAGTPLYLAPEVFAGKNRTMASEIYSVGVLLYFLVTGKYPLEGDTRTSIEELHAKRGARKPLRDVRPDLPDPFIRVVEQALAERPQSRYESAGTLEAALAETLPSRGPSLRPPVTNPALKMALVLLSLLVFALGSATVYRLMLRPPSDGGGENAGPPRDVAAVVPEVTATAGDTPGEYRIDAAFYRDRAGGVERLQPGTHVSQDESLSLQVEVSAPAYVYVVNEDEHGESFLLFPLPGFALTNPLQPGQRHRLPGMWDGEAISWQVTSAGKKEHFLIVASPERSRSFEEMFATLPRPSFGKRVAGRKLSGDELGVLRSVGGLAPSPLKGDRQLRLLPEFSIPLSAIEESVRGVWIRHATFENPVN